MSKTRNAGGQGENFPYYRYAGNLNQEQLKEQLQTLQTRISEKNRKIKLWKGRDRHEDKAAE